MSSYKRGEIYYVEAYPAIGCEQHPGRPAIVVSNNKNNEHSSVLDMIYLTTAAKTSLPTHVTICSAPRISTALCEQVHSIDMSRVKDYCGCCTEQELRAVDTALHISLGLNTPGIPIRQSADTVLTVSDTPDLIAVKAQLELMRQMYDALLRHKTRK